MTCQVHQFCGKIAIWVGGKTVYFTPEEATTLAKGILAHVFTAEHPDIATTGTFLIEVDGEI